jgi:hypothetical protein
LINKRYDYYLDTYDACSWCGFANNHTEETVSMTDSIEVTLSVLIVYDLEDSLMASMICDINVGIAVISSLIYDINASIGCVRIN